MSYLSEPYEDGIRAAIASQLPDEKINTLEVLTHGTECVAVDLNDRYILKFPIPERTLEAIRAEYSVLHFLQGKVDMTIPNPAFFEGTHPFMMYEKIPGERFNVGGDYLLFCPLTPKEEKLGVEYVIHSEKEKEQLAEDIALFFAQIHAVDLKELKAASDVTFSPACILSDKNMRKHVRNNIDPLLKDWLAASLEYFSQFKCSDDDKVLGHFDCTNGNMLYSPEKQRLKAVFDFGNAQIDDYHRDLSCMNLTAPKLTQGIISRYERLTGRNVNRELVDFYTTFMHLYCVTELGLRKRLKELQMWQGSLQRWHTILTQKKLPEIHFPDEWRIWIGENMMLGTSIEEVVEILEKEGFDQQQIRSEVYHANLHPYVMAARRLLEKEVPPRPEPQHDNHM